MAGRRIKSHAIEIESEKANGFSINLLDIQTLTTRLSKFPHRHGKHFRNAKSGSLLQLVGNRYSRSTTEQIVRTVANQRTLLE